MQVLLVPYMHVIQSILASSGEKTGNTFDRGDLHAKNDPKIFKYFL